ncbi:unnamed protein product [Spirodela intermedia]|uniref:Aldehyde dehydrogenase domain-containing protein n=1 Tax=Spirodela intermedia TaxID=51605 RepID=A0ABN7EB51_SPIIN|nr:unnamed protein product [Spirodela intermedia]
MACHILHSQGKPIAMLSCFCGKWVLNPATGEVITSVPWMGRKETADAIVSSYEAFSSWSKLIATERSKYLRKWYDLIVTTRRSCFTANLEQGKPLKEALGEVGYGANFIEFYAERQSVSMPVGVVAAITPWNFLSRHDYSQAVVKPSEFTPLTALAVAELALQAGIPPGALNVVMGNAPEIGDTLLESPQVRKITFTGSTNVGKKLMAGAAKTVKKVSLELGGNAPCIVFDDADLDLAVRGCLELKFRNSGQTCVSANRIFVQDGIYEKFSGAFSKAVKAMQVGNGLAEGTVQGPLINEAAVQKVESLIKDATSKDIMNSGCEIVLGGKRHSLGMTEEIFGPVAPLLRFKTEKEAIHMANDTNAGLAAFIYTTSIPRSWLVSEALEYGMIGVAPFGGVKQSGLGREGSKYGMDEYMETKYVCLGNIKDE